MGKSKKRSRASAKRSAPFAKKAGNSGAKDAQTVDKKIGPLLNKLQSAVPNDRSMALSSISVLCEDPHMRQLLLKEKLIQVVMTKLLTDENTDIVVEAFGLLRNLSLEEGYHVSVHLWRSDIWVSIVDGFAKTNQSVLSLVNESSDAQQKKIKGYKESKKMLFDYVDNLLSLTVALANGSDDILNQLMEEDKLNKIFEVITGLLQYGPNKLPTNLFNTILDLICDFSSESLDFIDSINSNSFLKQFTDELPRIVASNASYNELTKVLVQGIQLEFLDTNITMDQANDLIHNVCNAVNDVDLAQVKKDMSILEDDQELVKAQDLEVATKIKDYTRRRNNAMMRLQSIEIAIDLMTAMTEILASIFESNKNLQLSENLASTLTTFLPHVFQTLSSEFASRTLIAWNNLIWLYITVGINIFQLNNGTLEKLWEYIKSLDEPQQQLDLDTKIGRMSVIWAILKSAALNESSKQCLDTLQLSGSTDFVHSTITLYNDAKQSSDNELAQDNLELRQRCCGVLGTYATFQGQIAVNQQVGDFFMTELADESTPQFLLVEITNLLFEIYPDGAFDYDKPVFVQSNYLQILQSKVVPNLKKQFKLVDKNKDPELKEKCQTCFATLNSFIQYKATE